MKTRNALLLVGGGAALAWAVWAPVVGQRGSSPAASVGVADPALDRAPAVAPGAAGPVAQATQPAAADLSDPPPPAAEVLVQVQAAGAHTSDRAVWDAARRLQAQPALADDLAELVLTPGTLPGGRALAMDLLAQSGHPQAQRALVRVLQDPRLAQRADAAERSLLVQRIGMVPQPLPETVDQAVALATAQDPVVRRAALAAAGGLARRLAVGGDPAGAEALLDRAVRPAPTEDVEDAAA
ncbi:MAG: hypothetical protein KC613_28465, partial [Myxococcales bacterium]|nr:hypothetical protein [Myxococcales bacterium]